MRIPPTVHPLHHFQTMSSIPLNRSIRLTRPSVLAMVFFALVSSWGLAEKPGKEVPGAPHLLPVDTLGYIRFDRFDDLREDWPSTSMGQMLADPAMRPFASDFYQTLSELFQEVGDDLGVTLDELLAIPEGQIAAAVVPGNLSPEQIEWIAKDEKEKDESTKAIRKRLARKRKSQNALAGWFMIDAGDKLDTLTGIIEKMEATVSEQGYVRRVLKIDNHDLVRWLPPRPGRSEIEYFIRDQTVVLGIGHGTAAQSLKRWDNPRIDQTLAKNADFAALMSRRRSPSFLPYQSSR